MTRQKLVIKLDDLRHIEPLTEKQHEVFQGWKKHLVHVLHGSAGTGKTFIALFKSLCEVLGAARKYDKIVILRSAVPARDIGALPGDEQEKTAVYELPYIEMCSSLFNRQDAYERLKEQGKIKFAATSYIRGITFDNSIILVDEIQNLNYQELYSVITRVGDNSKIVFCGDFKQTDLRDSGLHKFLNILKCVTGVAFYEFSVDDIVRSNIVKQFIIAEERYVEPPITVKLPNFPHTNIEYISTCHKGE